MKLKINYKRTTKDIAPLEVIDKGEWIDLRVAEDVHLSEGEFKLVSLGVRLQIPEGFEAWVVPRSSTFRNFGIIQANSFGIIDSSYCGPNDVWKMTAYATRAVAILKDTRICQFRIMPSQKASKEVRELWNNCDGIELEEKDWIASDRGGFGSTGVK